MSSRTKRIGKMVSLVLAMAMVFTTIGTLLPDKDVQKVEKKIIQQIGVEQVQAKPNDPEPPPNISKGTPTWRAVRDYYLADQRGQLTTLVPDGFAAFNEYMTGLTLEDLNNLVRDYEDKGVVLSRLYPAGTVVINSGYSWKKKKFQRYDNWKFKTARTLLVLPDGYIPVKQRSRALSWLGISRAWADGLPGEPAEGPSCGNGMRIISVPKEKPGKPEQPPPPPPPGEKKQGKKPINSEPLTTPHHPDNPFTQQPSENAEKAQPTPGVQPGVPEATKQSQDDNAGCDKAVPGGKTGQDEGSVTNPDGSKESAPEPNKPPDTTDDSCNEGDPGMPN